MNTMLRYFILFCAVVSSCLGQVEFVRGNVEELGMQMSKLKDSPGKKWALLVAGSNNYYNYRHQVQLDHYSLNRFILY